MFVSSLRFHGRRAFQLPVALLLAAALLAGGSLHPRAAYAYNCVNVVLRDPYWAQYRRIVESGWNAAGVGTAFARHGFPVDGMPAPGTIMVWPAGAYGASGVGHVGVVVSVNGNGTVVVRHENWPYGSAEHPQTFAVQPGHRFVHPLESVVSHIAEAEADEADAA